MKKSSQKIVSIKQAKKVLGKVRKEGCASTDYLTKDQVEKMIRSQFKAKDYKKALAKFWEWMYGQTGIVISYTDGTSECGIYLWDLERYLEMALRGKATYFD